MYTVFEIFAGMVDDDRGESASSWQQSCTRHLHVIAYIHGFFMWINDVATCIEASA